MPIDGQEIDTTNKFCVGVRGNGKVVIVHPPVEELSKHDAIMLAAWIVAMAGDKDSFDAAWKAIQSIRG